MKRLVKAGKILLGLLLSSYLLIYFVWSKPINPHDQARLERLVKCGHNIGFKFKDPNLRAIRFFPVVHSRLFAGIALPFGYLPFIRSIIIISNPPANENILAHELGHVIDFEMLRSGHPFFKQRGHHRYTSIETVADDIRDELIRTCPLPQI